MKGNFMSLLKPLAVAALALGLVTGTAFARQATDAENQALQLKINKIQPLIQKDDPEGTIQSMPPSVFQKLGEKIGVSADQTRDALRVQLKAMSQQAKTKSFSANLAKKVAYQLDNGEPVYVVPVSQVLEVQGKTVQIEMQMIAILEGGQWYLITTADPNQTETLQQLFPGIEKIKLEQPSVTQTQ